MPTFGLDDTYIKIFKDELNVEYVRQDQNTDFFVLPQFEAIYQHCQDNLKQLVISKLKSGKYGPKSAIEMEVPKSAMVSTKASSIVGPHYFRPGSVLYPEDRIVYHFIAQEAEKIIEKSIDRTRVFSNKPAGLSGQGFTSASIQWNSLKSALEAAVKSGEYIIALKCDISQYFFSINQHEMINQLEHQKLKTELVRFAENFLTGLTVDRSSRGILQGLYGSDVFGNGYLISIDEFIASEGLTHFRYVDDVYVLFRKSDELKSFFPKLVKRLRDYDLSLNESKTFAVNPNRLLREETELDKYIERAKLEASEKLTDYEEIAIEDPYTGESIDVLFSTEPDEQEVELEATKAVFDKLDDFKGEEKQRAENFCLSLFRKAGDLSAIAHVLRQWPRKPDQAREYAFYLNRFASDSKYAALIDKMIDVNAASMTDYQWAWAATIMRKLASISEGLLTKSFNMCRDGSQHEAVRSLLVYPVCAHGSAQRKKDIRDNYGQSPLLIQLAIIHCSNHFTSGERNALLKTAQTHGDIQSMMCDAFKAEQKFATTKNS